MHAKHSEQHSETQQSFHQKPSALRTQFSSKEKLPSVSARASISPARSCCFSLKNAVFCLRSVSKLFNKSSSDAFDSSVDGVPLCPLPSFPSLIPCQLSSLQCQCLNSQWNQSDCAALPKPIFGLHHSHIWRMKTKSCGANPY